MTYRILFVCLGNICRSPSAEAVFRAKVAEAGLDVDVDSAGTAGWHIGKAPYTPMQKAAAARGYDLSSLRARQVVPKDFDAFDLVVAMDAENRADLEALRGADAPAKLTLFTDYASGTEDHVPDPYYTRDFEEALDLIEDAADGLVRALTTKTGC